MSSQSDHQSSNLVASLHNLVSEANQRFFDNPLGDTIELRNRYFVVDKVTVHYKLEYGKYRKDDTRLYVQEATRYLLNKHLDSLLAGSDAVKDPPRSPRGGSEKKAPGEENADDDDRETRAEDESSS